MGGVSEKAFQITWFGLCVAICHAKSGPFSGNIQIAERGALEVNVHYVIYVSFLRAEQVSQLMGTACVATIAD